MGVWSLWGATARLYMSQPELGLRNPQAALDTLADKLVEITPRRRASMAVSMCARVWGCGWRAHCLGVVERCLASC